MRETPGRTPHDRQTSNTTNSLFGTVLVLLACQRGHERLLQCKPVRLSSCQLPAQSDRAESTISVFMYSLPT